MWPILSLEGAPPAHRQASLLNHHWTGCCAHTLCALSSNQLKSRDVKFQEGTAASARKDRVATLSVGGRLSPFALASSCLETSWNTF